MNVGQTILNIRKEYHYTQEDFAELFHVTRQTVSNWENEKSYPDLQTLVDISDRFDISLDKILKEDKNMVENLNVDIRKGKNARRNILIACLLTLGICIAVIGIYFYHYGKTWLAASEDVSVSYENVEGVATLNFKTSNDNCYLNAAIDPNSPDVISIEEAYVNPLRKPLRLTASLGYTFIDENTIYAHDGKEKHLTDEDTFTVKYKDKSVTYKISDLYYGDNMK